ncbi:MAG: hypothetical protein LBE49_08560, partial [Deltaproteobacteria bacterium]|nr:hypothetical protein [Deltaproteobacteria bacterium]
MALFSFGRGLARLKPQLFPPLLLFRGRARAQEPTMETRVAIIGVVVENPDSVEELNRVLHQYS